MAKELVRNDGGRPPRVSRNSPGWRHAPWALPRYPAHIPGGQAPAPSTMAWCGARSAALGVTGLFIFQMLPRGVGRRDRAMGSTGSRWPDKSCEKVIKVPTSLFHAKKRPGPLSTFSKVTPRDRKFARANKRNRLIGQGTSVHPIGSWPLLAGNTVGAAGEDLIPRLRDPQAVGTCLGAGTPRLCYLLRYTMSAEIIRDCLPQPRWEDLCFTVHNKGCHD
jgi:hypothetical protein